MTTYDGRPHPPDCVCLDGSFCEWWADAPAEGGVSKSRRWGVYVFRQARGAPMVSLGIHLDFHTPRVDLHLPLVTVCIGRIVWQRGRRRAFYLDDHKQWSGHTDDCWHREALADAERAA